MTTAVRHCGQLVTLAGPQRPRVGPEMRELSVIDDGAFVMDGPAITWVGPDRDLPGADQEIDAGGRMVTPGLVDAHTHAIFAGNRANEFELRAQGVSYREIKEAGGGIMSTVRATRAASPEELVRLRNEKLEWMLRCGTTMAEVKTGYGLDPETEAKLLWVSIQDGGPIKTLPTFLGAHAVPPEAASKAAYVQEVIENMIPNAALYARCCDIFVEEGYFDADDARKILSAAKAQGMKPKLHVDQFTNNGGAKLAAELGAKTADHLEQTDLEGIRALREAGVCPVLLPASVFLLGLHKYAEARLMIDEGLPVVLATDFNPGSSPTPSLPFVMSLGCTQMKMTPAECITACTINAAYALDEGGAAGSLEVGKRADFVIWDLDDYRELAYWAGRETAHAVFASGQQVYARD